MHMRQRPEECGGIGATPLLALTLATLGSLVLLSAKMGGALRARI